MNFDKEQGTANSSSGHTILHVTFSSNLQSKVIADYSPPEACANSQPPFFSKSSYSPEDNESVNTAKVNSNTPPFVGKETGISKSAVPASDPQISPQVTETIPYQNILEAKMHLKRILNVNRLCSAYVRRERRRMKHTKKFSVSQEEDNIYSRFAKEFLISPISAFNHGPDSSSNDQPSQIPIFESLEEDLNEGDAIDREAEEKSPRTPEANAESRSALRRRNEETPFRKAAVEIPEHVFNSDDEKMNYVYETAFS
eukprot:TRINITY_DN11963_c0_g1_i11.p1 TRINITY_DN11963_c0_g1~~TRINITY_DN11963_c0_g1_i11.p1  ORF type:complete len:256 (-),score=21.72 TRINITY_DN11963_c0_g1_i11:180-947(-)